MKKAEFIRLKTIKDEESLAKEGFELGDKFLYGESVINQVNEKKSGEVTYYKVIGINKRGNVIFSPVIDKLED